MTRSEHSTMTALLEGDPTTIRDRFAAYLDTALIKEYEEIRTNQQNRALHMWFEQVASLCRDAGYDAKVIMNNTVSVEMNADIVKGMWKVMQEALYGTTSTTELQKAKQIEHIVDHFIRFFGEKFGLELPPFPSREFQPNLISGTSVPYPGNYEPPKL